MRMVSRQHTLAVFTLLIMSIFVSACTGATEITRAATVNGQAVSMSMYLKLARLYYEASRLNDPMGATWQKSDGRLSLANARKQAIYVLVNNILLEDAARSLKLDLHQIQQTEDQNVNGFFHPLQAQLQPLADQGILTTDTLHPIARQQALQNAVFKGATIDIAHVKILTFKSKGDADEYRKELSSGTADWAKIAANASLDAAAQSGGEVMAIPHHVFPSEVDTYIFGKNTKVGDISTPIHSSAGYSLVQLIARQNQKIADLGNNSPVFPNARISPQGAAVASYLIDQQAKEGTDINVNWCGNIAGQDCPPINMMQL